MPGVLRFEQSLGAGATTANLLAGTFMERLGTRPEVVTIFSVIDVTAAAEGLFTLEFRLGNVVVADAMIIPMFTAQEGPNRNQHKVAVAVGAPFDLVQIRLFNGAGGAIRHRTLVEQVMM